MTIKRKENQKNQSFEVLEAGCLAGWLVGWLAACLLQFLIQFLFKIDANSYLWLPSSSCGHFTLNSYSELMQIHLLDALPPPVVISYSIRKIISWTQIAAFTFNPNHDSRP